MSSRSAALTTETRRQKLAAIHVAKSQLKLDDDTYRALIERVSALVSDDGTSVRSSADLSARGLNAVLDEMRRLGADKPTAQYPRGRAKPAHYPGTPHNIDELPAEISKIEALLSDLQLSWAYADGIAKRMHGIDRVAWCTKREQLVSIIAALHVEQEKRQLLTSITEQCARTGRTLDQLAASMNLANGWQRRRSTLKAVREGLLFDALCKELGYE